MKAAEQTSSHATASPKTSAPFFNKSGSDSFFGTESTAEPFFSPKTVQPKLTIGSPNDVYEQQADAVADQVVAKLSSPDSKLATQNSKPTPSVQRQNIASEPEEKLQLKENELEKTEEKLQMKPIFESLAPPPPPPSDEDTVQRKCADCDKEDKEKGHIQKKNDGDTEGSPSADLSSRLSSSKGGGSPLSDGVRGSMESAIGADFSGVRIHTGSESVQMNRELNAHAFAHGNDVYFGAGNYNPSSSDGQRLLAHELTHTVQQGASVQRKPIAPTPTVQAQASTVIQRAETEEDVLQRSWIGDRLSSAADAIGGAVSNLNPRNALNNVAMNIPGFRLVTVIIGHNPILNQAVERTAENFVGGFLALLPGGNLLFQKLQETRAISQALTWLEGEVLALNITLAYVGSLISRVIDSLSITDISGSIDRAIAIIREPALRIIRFLGRVGTKIKEFIFRGALQLVGAPVNMIMGILARAGNVLQAIFDDPIAFCRNLIQSIIGGIRQFAANAGQHLLTGLIGWLTGALAGVGLQLPQQWNVQGIFSLVAQLLNVTYQAIRQKAVRVLGETTVLRMEQAFEFIRDLITRGPIVLWERVSEFLGNLQDMVMGGIREFVMSRLIQQGVARLVSMFNPAGALIQAVLAIYNTIQFFMERAAQMATFARAVFESISQIASGNLGAAMSWIENALARSIPVILGFIGRLLGLGNISEHIRTVIQRVRQPIDRAIDRVVDWLAGQARRLVNGVRGGGNETQSPERTQALSTGLATLSQKENTYADGDSISKENAEKVAIETRQAHPSVFERIRVIDSGADWGYDYIQRSKKKKQNEPEPAQSVTLPENTIIPTKGHYQGKPVIFGDPRGKHTKVANYAIAELKEALRKPNEQRGALKGFVQGCASQDARYGSQLSSEGSRQYKQLVLDALENGNYNAGKFRHQASFDIGIDVTTSQPTRSYRVDGAPNGAHIIPLTF